MFFPAFLLMVRDRLRFTIWTIDAYRVLHSALIMKIQRSRYHLGLNLYLTGNLNKLWCPKNVIGYNNLRLHGQRCAMVDLWLLDQGVDTEGLLETIFSSMALTLRTRQSNRDTLGDFRIFPLFSRLGSHIRSSIMVLDLFILKIRLALICHNFLWFIWAILLFFFHRQLYF